jgi:hypothetical protein
MEPESAIGRSGEVDMDIPTKMFFVMVALTIMYVPAAIFGFQLPRLSRSLGWRIDKIFSTLDAKHAAKTFFRIALPWMLSCCLWAAIGGMVIFRFSDTISIVEMAQTGALLMSLAPVVAGLAFLVKMTVSPLWKYSSSGRRD